MLDLDKEIDEAVKDKTGTLKRVEEFANNLPPDESEKLKKVVEQQCLNVIAEALTRIKDSLGDADLNIQLKVLETVSKVKSQLNETKITETHSLVSNMPLDKLLELKNGHRQIENR